MNNIGGIAAACLITVLLLLASCRGSVTSETPTKFVAAEDIRLALGANRLPPEPARAELPMLLAVSAYRYEGIERRSGLPRDVSARMKGWLGETMAEHGDRFSDSCLVDPSLPRSRFAIAAVCDRWAVIEYETGGYAPVRHIVILDRTSPRDEPAWHGFLYGSGEDSNFLQLLTTGSLWTRATRWD